MKKLMRTSTLLVFSLELIFASLSVPAFAWDLRGIRRNNEGVARFRDEKINDAYDRFAQGLGDLPFQAELHYNLGRTYFENKEYEKSIKESLATERLAGNAELKFHALFQAGTAAASMKKIEEALAFYQRALEFKPDSKETKTNIELLLADGQGGGQGDQQQQQQQGDQQKEPQDGNGQQQQQQQSGQQQRPTPRPFKSENLGKKDVENILDELKQQEEQIRAKFQREGAKDAPREKDW